MSSSDIGPILFISMFVSTIVGRPAQRGKTTITQNAGLKEQQAWI
jgi:hypothetical protein